MAIKAENPADMVRPSEPNENEASGDRNSQDPDSSMAVFSDLLNN